MTLIQNTMNVLIRSIPLNTVSFSKSISKQSNSSYIKTFNQWKSYSSRTGRRNAKSTYKNTIFKPTTSTGIPRNTNFHSKLSQTADWSYLDENRIAPDAPGLAKRKRKILNFYARIIQQARRAEELATLHIRTLPSVSRHRKRDVAFGRQGIERDMFSFQLKKRRLVRLHNT